MCTEIRMKAFNITSNINNDNYSYPFKIKKNLNCPRLISCIYNFVFVNNSYVIDGHLKHKNNLCKI